MKKIKVSQWRPYEAFDQMVPFFEKYFLGGGSHVIGPSVQRRQVWVFPSCLTLQCEGCTKQEDISLSSFLEYSSFEFFDWDTSVHVPETCRIKVNGKFAGFFCRKIESLFLTDWTHNDECVQIAKELFPQLIEKLGLKEIEEDVYPDAEVMLGADPEFEELESWDKYVPHSATIIDDGFIGKDAAGWQVELRPRPSTSPEGIVANIKALVEKLTIPISVKGDCYPIGGHIHIGFRNVEGNEAEIVSAIVSALDDFLGSLLMDLSGQARGSYKKLGAWREKRWGFEYRTLPSAVFLNPEITKIIFKIVKNVAEKLLRARVIEYNDTPTLEDYTKIGGLTSEEYSSLINFIEEYKNYDGRAINANWLPQGK